MSDRYEPELLVEVAFATFARASASVLEEQLRMTFQSFGIHIQPNLSKQFGLRGEFLLHYVFYGECGVRPFDFIKV